MLDYSQYEWSFHFLYGRALFSGPSMAMPVTIITPIESTLENVKIIFYSAEGEKIFEVGTDIRNNILEECLFSLATRGCDSFKIKLSKLPWVYLPPRTRVDIHMFGDAVNPYYSGFLIDVPPVNKQAKSFDFNGFGFIEQLKWIRILDNFSSGIQVSSIIKALMISSVEPNTDIVYNPYLIVNTDYLIPAGIFWERVACNEVFDELATLAGNWEYGVNQKRELYFRPATTTLNPYMSLYSGVHFEEFNPTLSMDEIVNRLWIKSGELKESGDDEGTNWVGKVGDPASIAIYGLREDVVIAPSMLGDALALRWGLYELLKVSGPTLSGKLKNFQVGNSKVPAAGKARIWFTMMLDSEWAPQLIYLGTRVPGWDWDSISIPETATGQIFWEYGGSNLYTFCFELWVKKLDWKIGTSFQVDAELGKIDEFIAEEFFQGTLRLRRADILTQRNTAQLYDLT